MLFALEQLLGLTLECYDFVLYFGYAVALKY